jgi:hypothetical protein
VNKAEVSVAAMLRRHPLFEEILARVERPGVTIFSKKHGNAERLPTQFIENSRLRTIFETWSCEGGSKARAAQVMGSVSPIFRSLDH